MLPYISMLSSTSIMKSSETTNGSTGIKWLYEIVAKNSSLTNLNFSYNKIH